MSFVTSSKSCSYLYFYDNDSTVRINCDKGNVPEEIYNKQLKNFKVTANDQLIFANLSKQLLKYDIKTKTKEILEISDEYIYDLSNDEKFIIIITRNKM